MGERVVSEAIERPWQPWERNFSGGRIGVQEQQGSSENWIILHVESGGVKTTTSLRPHEAWQLALLVSPQLSEDRTRVYQELRTMRDALHSLTHRGVDTDLIRSTADDMDCGDNCDYAGLGGPCSRIERDGCGRADADSLRDLAKAIDTANESTKADVLRAIDACGGADTPSESADWNRGYNEALAASEREVTRLFERSATA